jgi:hypothetical protein
MWMVVMLTNLILFDLSKPAVQLNIRINKPHPEHGIPLEQNDDIDH